MLDERSERSGDGPPAAGPARIVRPATRPSDRGLVVALIAAQNEEDQIEDAVRSLNEQTLPPDLILVVLDNAHKAGALNRALDVLLPELRHDDSVLVMAAGSTLAPGFVSKAPRRL